jgi:hypothetical protein
MSRFGVAVASHVREPDEAAKIAENSRLAREDRGPRRWRGTPFGPRPDTPGAAQFLLCKAERLCYTLPAREQLCRLFLGSSAVEHSTVNRMVAGSNPARGASKINHLAPFPQISQKPRVGTVLANRLPLAIPAFRFLLIGVPSLLLLLKGPVLLPLCTTGSVRIRSNLEAGRAIGRVAMASCRSKVRVAVRALVKRRERNRRRVRRRRG